MILCGFATVDCRGEMPRGTSEATESFLIVGARLRAGSAAPVGSTIPRDLEGVKADASPNASCCFRLFDEVEGRLRCPAKRTSGILRHIDQERDFCIPSLSLPVEAPSRLSRVLSTIPRGENAGFAAFVAGNHLPLRIAEEASRSYQERDLPLACYWEGFLVGRLGDLGCLKVTWRLAGQRTKRRNGCPSIWYEQYDDYQVDRPGVPSAGCVLRNGGSNSYESCRD